MRLEIARGTGEGAVAAVTPPEALERAFRESAEHGGSIRLALARAGIDYDEVAERLRNEDGEGR